MSIVRMQIAVATAAIALASFADDAAAKCTRLAFSVNDYGKDGPTKDAKELLDKLIVSTMAEKGIKSYRVGKKDVNCELFIDLIVFDEYTCRAEANVCWDEKSGGAASSDASAPVDPKSAKSATKGGPAKAVPGLLTAPQPATTAVAPGSAADDKLPAVAEPAAEPPVGGSAAGPAVVAPAPEPPAVRESASDNAAAASSPAIEEAVPNDTASQPATAGGTETGAIERFAAPKRIVSPEDDGANLVEPVEPAAP